MGICGQPSCKKQQVTSKPAQSSHHPQPRKYMQAFANCSRTYILQATAHCCMCSHLGGTAPVSPDALAVPATRNEWLTSCGTSAQSQQTQTSTNRLRDAPLQVAAKAQPVPVLFRLTSTSRRWTTVPHDRPAAPRACTAAARPRPPPALQHSRRQEQFVWADLGTASVAGCSAQ